MKKNKLQKWSLKQQKKFHFRIYISFSLPPTKRKNSYRDYAYHYFNYIRENRCSFCEISFDFISESTFLKSHGHEFPLGNFRPESRSSVGSMRTSRETTDLKHSLNLESYFLSGSHEIGFDYAVRLRMINVLSLFLSVNEIIKLLHEFYGCNQDRTLTISLIINH